MRVSGDEFLRLSQLRPGQDTAGSVATAVPFTDLGSDTDMSQWETARRLAEQVVEFVPDVREDIIASLRARVESGSYQVSGEQIAEMMIRRLIADRVR